MVAVNEPKQVDPEILPFRNSTAVLDDGRELNQRMQRDGYLFIQGLLPPQVLESLRQQVLTIERDAGWVKDDTPLRDAVADLNGFCVEPEPAYNNVYYNLYKLADFHALQHRPELKNLFERMLGEPVLAHPRIIMRTIFPQREAYTTPPHQDFIPIQGTPDTFTTWIPLGDLPPIMGGLQLAEGSHAHGVYEFEPSLGAGAMEVTDPLKGRWRNSPFKQGDVLIFHSMTVHQGVPCQGTSLRISVDARYQKISDPIAPDSLEPHNKPVTWKEVYADWRMDDQQYYWHQWNLQIKDFDNSYYEERDRKAIQLAKQGDIRARSTLQRIIARDSDPAKQQQARGLLTALETRR